MDRTSSTSIDPSLSGVFLALVTPFRDGALDEASLSRLVAHFAASPIAGFVLAATTGEGLVLDEDETERLVAIAAAAAGPLPLWLGISGSDTRRLKARLDATARWPIAGHLVACPAYTRPPQDGLRQHFTLLARDAAKPILLYNIPYRTGVNLANETLLRLAELPAIRGVKDCCADAAQSFDLLRHRPPGFAVLTGEDALFHTALTQGADGGILAAAQADPAAFVALREAVLAGDLSDALQRWQGLVDLARLLFAEPSPAPIKHWLWRSGLIASPELRLPMTGVSPALAGKLDRLLWERRAAT
ncbi:MAG TPA: 4-hydroxy-tetrahydrodipicolinate synthase [Stellaceae bacterium]|nr:4-hydroxy-tetrahydrodipicolinate synthase [Stellaceae bacterium]